MSEPCEIYVRHSGGSNMLLAYGDASSLTSSSDEGEPIAIVELSILPEWITDAEKRRSYEASGELIHVRIPIHSANGFR